MAGARRLDIEGQKYGRLTVLSFNRASKNGSIWNVRCDCGALTVALTAEMRYGSKHSCGCLRREQSAKNMKRSTAGGRNSATFHDREAIVNRILGIKATRVIDRRPKPWNGAKAATADLAAALGLPSPAPIRGATRVHQLEM